MIQAVSPTAPYPSNAAPLHAGREGTMTAHGVLMGAQRVFSGPQRIHSGGG
jgi:hypothetical protein